MPSVKIVYIVSDIQHAVFFEQTALILHQKEYDVSFILINCSNSSLQQFLTVHQIKYHSFQCARIVQSLPCILKVRRLLKKINPSVVHTHLAMANWVGLWASKLAGIHHRLFTRHAGLPTLQVKKERIIDRIQNKLATRIVAISQVTKHILLQQGVPEEKITIVHHGFDLQTFYPPKKETVALLSQKYNSENQHPTIGIIARWIDWKGIQYIIPAFENLLKTAPNAKLLLFNASEKSSFAPFILNQLSNLPSKNYQTIAFEPEIASVYHLLDVFVHVPIDENCEAFGQIYVEALAAQTACVFTLSGIASEFIENRKNALVVDYQNSEAIHDALVTLLTDKKTAEEIAQQGFRDVYAQFSLTRYSKALFNLYQF